MLHKILFLMLSMVLAGSPVTGQEWARKMFKVKSHDFGDVARGAKTQFEFPLSNIYLEDVHITSVRTSCGCTTPTIKKADLKTYEKGAIVATFNTHSFQGRRSATLTVTFDRPFHGQVQLSVKGNIRNDVVLNPRSINFGSVDEGASSESRAAISFSGRSDLRILQVKSTNPHLSGEAVPRSTGYGRVAYDLVVHLDENAPAGYINDHLILVTNDYRGSQIPVTVEGNVLPGISVSPSSLFLGVVEPGKKVTKRVVVRGKKPFRILSITSDDATFEFNATDNAPPRPVHVIPVTFVAGEHSGKVTDTIRIETDLGESTPELAAYAVVTKP